MTPRRGAVLGLLALGLIGARAKAPVPPPKLGLPLACRIGSTCAVQNYMDDGGGTARDFLCRGRTYPKHNGTDFRIPSEQAMARGVPVLASAPGRVLRLRDGVPDLSVRTRGLAAVANEECGNGLVIAHAGGWETQYCHLRRGSLRVKPGARVREGTPLGLVGLSGDTEFPHVHLTVRHDGQVIDPFAYGAPAGSCGGGRPLWRERIGYQAGEPFVVGFATRAVTMAEVQASGADQRPQPTRDGPGLVAFVQAIGLQRGDVQTLTITGPEAKLVVSQVSPPLDGDKAQFLVAIGKRTMPGGWPAGVYQATYAVRREGTDVMLRTFRVRL